MKITRPTKRERRERRKEVIKEKASEFFDDFNIENKDDLLRLLFKLTEKLGLNPEINLNDKTAISYNSVDSNGYIVGKQEIAKNIKIDKITFEVISTINVINNGGCTTAGNLDNITITKTSYKILEKILGENWKHILSEKIKDQYLNGYGFSNSYVKHDDILGFKLKNRHVYVTYRPSNAYYRTGHLIIPQSEMPESVYAAMEGVKASDLVEGDLIKNALEGATVIKAECPETTTIIHLKEDICRIADI